MLKKHIIWGAVLGLSSFSAVAENNFSAELLGGVADQELSANGNSVSGAETSFGIRGAFSLNKNFAIEAAYQNYGEASDTRVGNLGSILNGSLTTTALNFGVKGMLPLNSSVSLNARLGLSIWDFEYKETNSSFPGQTAKDDDNGSSLYYGIGVQYEVNPQIFVGAEYTITQIDASINNVSSDLDIKNMSLSLGFKF